MICANGAALLLTTAMALCLGSREALAGERLSAFNHAIDDCAK